MSKTVQVRVHDDSHDWATDRPFNLIDYIAWLNEKLLLIPEQFRTNACVTIDSRSAYGDSVLEYYISYDRPETLDETLSREDRERKAKEYYDNLRRADYEKLKKIYEPGN